jgi:exopolyphosphatase/guanosine-5'-triphosphate,3'-diphosphate pyrophosphatase
MTSHKDTFAAVDLGSNSFHMVIARREPDGSMVVIDRLKEMVRLAAGLDDQRRLDAAARERALDCLRQFGQRLRELPQSNVRVIGTNTLRTARNADEFIDAAQEVLDHPVEVVSGMEEARLIYTGVTHSLAQEGRRLVIDIGGGSTEFIIGDGPEPLHKSSLKMGCVSLSRQHFGDGRITRKAFDAAELAAAVELEPIVATLRELGWAASIGTSGTIRAVGSTIREMDWGRDCITPRGLKRLRKALVDAGHVDKIDLKGVKPERYPVFPGGVAVLRAAFEALGIEEMRVSDGAMREGMLLDLPGRLQHADAREGAVRRLAERFHADATQARRVRGTLEFLHEQAREAWALDDESRWLLRWAADLHEIGLDIAHNSYHKHGAYIVANTDLAGFAREEQLQLATLVRSHRRRIAPECFGAIGQDRLLRMIVLLRLAVLLHRNRSPEPLPEMSLRVSERKVRLTFPEIDIASHPLTGADLAREAEYLASAGFTLRYG